MTLIVSWISRDNKPEGESNISAVYFCSDSRISWTVGKTMTAKPYDMAKKTYACSKYPEIFCYCGDVGFPSASLQSLVSAIDSGTLFKADSPFEIKKSEVVNFIQDSLSQYPKACMAEGFSIYYATCIKHVFYMVELSLANGGLVMNDLDLSPSDLKVFSAGSGKDFFDKMWKNSNQDDINEKGTSRNVYNCFTRVLDEALNHPNDPNLLKVGGSPQLVGLYRGGCTVVYGIIKNERRFFQGREVEDSPNLENIEWRNDCYERVDPHTMKPLADAQRQPFAPRKQRK